jgi:hypothetical protein
MRDIPKELEIIRKWDKRNKVSKARRRQIQNLGSSPVIVTRVPVKCPPAGKADEKPEGS